MMLDSLLIFMVVSYAALILWGCCLKPQSLAGADISTIIRIGCIVTTLTALGMVAMLVPVVWARVAAIVTW